MRKVRKYDVLFIDLDNTLYDFSTNSREAYRTVYDLLEYARWFDSFEHYYEIYEEYNLRLWALYAEGKVTKGQLNAERYSHPLRVVGVADADAIGTTFWDEAMKRLPLGSRLMPYAREVLEYLRPQYKMYILSNGFTELQSRKMQSADIARYFDGVVLSEDIGINKPNPAIFEYALRVADVAPSKALMIGDNFEVDIEGAYKAGIDQVFYCDKRLGAKGDLKSVAPDVGINVPTYTISSLLELEDIL